MDRKLHNSVMAAAFATARSPQRTGALSSRAVKTSLCASGMSAQESGKACKVSPTSSAGLLKRAPADPVAVLPFGAIPDKVGFTADGQTVFAHGMRFPTRLDDVLAAPGAAAAPAYDADSRVQLPRLLHLRRWQFTPAEKNDDDLATLVAGRKVEQGTMDILQASDWTERWEKRM